jgi:hypothetical protein
MAHSSECTDNRAALSQECAIVLRRTDFDGLGWLTVSYRSVLVERVATLVGRLAQCAGLRMLRAAPRVSSWSRPGPSTRGL